MTEHRTRHYEPGGSNSAGAPARTIELDDDSEIRLLTCPRRDGTEELRVSLRSFKGYAYADVRNWYDDRGTWKPGKGCTIKIHELAQVAGALDEASKRIDRQGRIVPGKSNDDAGDVIR